MAVRKLYKVDAYIIKGTIKYSRFGIVFEVPLVCTQEGHLASSCFSLLSLIEVQHLAQAADKIVLPWMACLSCVAEKLQCCLH